MKINHLPGAPGNLKTLPLSFRTLHLMQASGTMRLQRQPEQQHEEGGGADDKGDDKDDKNQQQQQQNQVTFSAEQQTEITRLIGEERKKWDTAAQAAKDQETQRLQQEKLREEGKHRELAETETKRADAAEAEIAKLKLDADRITACQAADLDIKHASRLVGTNLAELTADAKEFAKSIPLPKAASLQQSGTQSGGASGGQQNGGNNGGGNGGGNGSVNPGLAHINSRYVRPDKRQ